MKEITEEQALAELPGLVEESVGKRVERMRGWAREQLTAEADRCAGILAAGGDQILFPPPDKPPSRREMAKPTVDQLPAEGGNRVAYRDYTADELWDALATGLAIGALVPGGVDFWGMHFCTMPHKECPAGNVPPPSEEPEPPEAPLPPVPEEPQP